MKEEQLAKIPAGKSAANSAAAVKPPAPATPSAPKSIAVPKSITTLAVDVGGTGIKSAALDEKGKMITERQKIKTPNNATPKKIIGIIQDLAKMAGEFDRASVGFPGVIKNGVVYTAANLGKGWQGFNLEAALNKKLKVPVRIANDADVQGLACVTGHGDELVITLGTGFVFLKDQAVLDRINGACAKGGSTMYAAGIHPGFAGDRVPLVRRKR